jgi:uracil-DNA glycosylase
MDALRRNQYLQTMGVDVWVSRNPPAAVATTAVQTAEVPAAAARDATARARPAAPTGSGARADSFAGADSIQAAHVADAGHGYEVPPGAATVGGGQASSAASVGSRVGSSVGIATAGTDGGSSVRAAADAIATRLASGLAQQSTDGAPASALAWGPGEHPASTTWESLRSEVLACTKCPLHGSRTQGVFGVGSREAQWLVVGEAPGAEEDRRGEPFVGRAGHLLDAMLKAIGLDRGRNVYIANVLKSRPPGNRDPKPEEVSACLPYLMRQIELLRPRVMLAVGRIAAQNLLSTDVPLGRLRGKVHHFGELNTPLIVTYHPAYLLRTPGDKRKAWEDLKFARSVFQGLNPT